MGKVSTWDGKPLKIGFTVEHPKFRMFPEDTQWGFNCMLCNRRVEMGIDDGWYILVHIRGEYPPQDMTRHPLCSMECVNLLTLQLMD